MFTLDKMSSIFVFSLFESKYHISVNIYFEGEGVFIIS